MLLAFTYLILVYSDSLAIVYLVALVSSILSSINSDAFNTILKDRLEKLFDVMSSQTKSHIIALLALSGKMTVTQISKHIKTSRSNLYQAIS